MTAIAASVISFSILGQLVPPPPKPMPPKPMVEPQAAASSNDADAERKRIEAMLQKYAVMKLKGQVLEETFRRRLVRPKGPDGKPIESNDNTGPHELAFKAAIPSSEDAVTLHLESAEALGPKRYRLTLAVGIPFESIGGHYRFTGIGPSIGWKIDSVKAEVQIVTTLDLGWKMIENGNIGIYPGGFIDPATPEEERANARLIEDVHVEVKNLDLSRINVDGINGRRVFYRDGQPVEGGRLIRFIDGAAQQFQLQALIEGGINQAIRTNEPKLLEGINGSLQSELPKTQIQVTNFIEKLAIQASLPGKKPTGKPKDENKGLNDQNLKPVPKEI